MTKTELWTWDSKEAVNNADLSGFDVEALDGHIGKVDEATYDAGASCLVVDTGFWIFGKKRMIPAGTITAVDLTNNTLRVGMSKDQIKSAPDYDEAKRDREDYRNRQDEYYSGLR